MHTKGDDSDRKSGGEHLNLTALDDAGLKAKGVNLCGTLTGRIVKVGHTLPLSPQCKQSARQRQSLEWQGLHRLAGTPSRDTFEINLKRRQIRLVALGEMNEEDVWKRTVDRQPAAARSSRQNSPASAAAQPG